MVTPKLSKIKRIDPNANYDRDSFVASMKDLGKLEQSLEIMDEKKHFWEPEVRKTLADLLEGDQTKYEALEPDKVINLAREAHEDHNGDVLGYVNHNYNPMTELLKGEDILQLLMSLPVRTVGNPDLDSIIQKINDAKEISKVKSDSDVIKYVSEQMKNAEEWRKRAYFGYSQGNVEYNKRTFTSYVKQISHDLDKSVKAPDGSLKVPELLQILRANYEKFVDDDPDGKEAKAYQALTGRAVYARVK